MDFHLIDIYWHNGSGNHTLWLINLGRILVKWVSIMTNIILVIILWGLLGGVLASADVTVYTWQFWAVEAICAAISILAYARGRSYRWYL